MTAGSLGRWLRIHQEDVCQALGLWPGHKYSLLLSPASVRLSPLYDLNSHLAYSDGKGNDLSMSVTGIFRASRISRDGWRSAAAGLQLSPEWLLDEIQRQRTELPDALAASASAPDIARYGSSAVARLLDNAAAWLRAR